jgi:fructan beta-fructosidase
MTGPVTFLFLVATGAAGAKEADIVVADFEGDTFAPWIVTGDGFGPGPAAGSSGRQKPVSGIEGARFVNSAARGEGGTGRLVSPEFVIERQFLRFLIGSGWRTPGQTAMNLLVDGRAVRKAQGKEGAGESLRYEAWDVSDLRGTKARIEVVDTSTSGHILADQIVQTDVALRRIETKLDVTAPYLRLPVRNGGRKLEFDLWNGDELVRKFDFGMAVDTPPDWWAFDDLGAFRGVTLTVRSVDRVPEDRAAAIPALFRQGERPVAEDDLYREAGRPQLHFTPRRGWNNDPNGLAYFNGEYHMFYQANPFGLDNWNKHWGHAVSTDLVHWTELPPAIYPVKGGARSGGSYVDVGNRFGFGGRRKEDVLIASYTGNGERVAVGTGRALTLTDLPHNPMIRHQGRDPKIVRYEPGDKWVMVVYEEAPQAGYAFYDSKDLKSWRRMFCVAGGHECPDFFEMTVEGESTRKWVLYGACHRKDPANPEGELQFLRSAYMLGSFDGDTFTPETDFLPGVSGPNFYAAQTFDHTPRDRRVLMGWLSGATYPGMPFSQGITLPLDMKLRRTPEGLRISFSPVPEIERLRLRPRELKNPTIAEANDALAEASAELMDIDLDLSPGESGKVALSVRGFDVEYDPASRRLSCHGKRVVLAPNDGRLRLRLLIDRGVIELFANDGRLGMTFAGPMDPAANVRLRAGPSAHVASLRVAAMSSIWAEEQRNDKPE